ncbi:hypothetical protein BDF20DRAFT_989827 [Mycotypha africana]|uniref:uncharacterized protein n=1 Tax=Mycotypha africana TaxID=64632 RepID=UPI0023004FB9|nr:uncharacterized protein BDF20DRAFT_989827 [Mycotypha africana]KAI8971525.1 hypothetical protein BDF20DRAFT_989827 [Mycotypha africana]
MLNMNEEKNFRGIKIHILTIKTLENAIHKVAVTFSLYFVLLKLECSEIRQDLHQTAIKAITIIHKGGNQMLTKAAKAASTSVSSIISTNGYNETSITISSNEGKSIDKNDHVETAATTANTIKINEIYSPTIIFPYTNNPCLQKMKEKFSSTTVAEKHKQWESIFNPQYSFGSFEQGIPRPKPTYEFFYKGQWPLAQEDIVGTAPITKSSRNDSATKQTVLIEQLQKLESSSLNTTISTTASASKDSKSIGITTDNNNDDKPQQLLLTPVPDPQLPNLKHLQHNINRGYSKGIHYIKRYPQNNIKNDYSNGAQVENGSKCQVARGLSDEGVTYYDASELTIAEEEKLWKERLEILKTLQYECFNNKWNGTEYNPLQSVSMTTRIQRRLKNHALKLKQQAIFIDTDPIVNNQSTKLTEVKENLARSNVITLDDQLENVSSKLSTGSPKLRTRLSFLFFVLGFLFPPTWILGAFYTPKYTSATAAAAAAMTAEKLAIIEEDYHRKIDYRWKKYSKNALAIFLFILTIALVLTLAFNPDYLGYRSSKKHGYRGELVNFDESAAAAVNAAGKQ